MKSLSQQFSYMKNNYFTNILYFVNILLLRSIIESGEEKRGVGNNPNSIFTTINSYIFCKVIYCILVTN